MNRGRNWNVKCPCCNWEFFYAPDIKDEVKKTCVKCGSVWF